MHNHECDPGGDVNSVTKDLKAAGERRRQLGRDLMGGRPYPGGDKRIVKLGDPITVEGVKYRVVGVDLGSDLGQAALLLRLAGPRAAHGPPTYRLSITGTLRWAPIAGEWRSAHNVLETIR